MRFLLPFVGGMLFFIGWLSAALPTLGSPAFITTVTSGESFTHEEYHARVRAQLNLWGYTQVCTQHLNSIPRPRHTSEAWAGYDNEVIGSAWRSIEVYTEECNDISSGRRPLG